MCRSATIHGRSPSGSARRGGRLRPRRARSRARRARPPPRRTSAARPRLGPPAPSRTRTSSCSASRAAAAAASSGWSARPGGSASAQPAADASSRTRARPVDAGHEDRRGVQQRRAGRAVAGGPQMHAAAPGRGGSWAGRSAASCAAGRPPSRAGRAARRITPRAITRSFGRSSTTIVFVLAAGREERRVDAGREQPVVAGEALLGRLARRLGERDQRVEAREQLLALRAGRRVAEPVRRRERRDAQRVAVAEREVGERRQAGLEAVHDVEPPCCSASDRFACTPTGTPICERREIGTAGPTAITSALSPRCSARRPASRSAARVDGAMHRHFVAEPPQFDRDAADVLVHVVRLRPRERRHQADPHRLRLLGAWEATRTVAAG